jgi:hypothetical protein
MRGYLEISPLREVSNLNEHVSLDGSATLGAQFPERYALRAEQVPCRDSSHSKGNLNRSRSEKIPFGKSVFMDN